MSNDKSESAKAAEVIDVADYFTAGEQAFDTLPEAKQYAKTVYDETDKIAMCLCAGIFKSGDRYVVRKVYR